ncbi:MAG: hypothetical protein J0I99_09185 [Devosia sp.]|mgnify:CR=1 FL=1|uniref:hypothetical protein n=1 Tax=Devosia sp. TaxID=1871048 RepID=UPI001AC680C3|nr:hypothetical protein [Devosia sp.]MBN9315898.1 hypothetical protein [Devosia sp.]
MRSITLGLLLFAALGRTAQAEELSPAVDRLLWCGSALYWLSADAYDAGNDAEGDQYEAWSENLGSRAELMLQSEGRDEAAISAIRDDYDNRVVAEMGQPGAKYDVTACPDLAQ